MSSTSPRLRSGFNPFLRAEDGRLDKEVAGELCGHIGSHAWASVRLEALEQRSRQQFLREAQRLRSQRSSSKRKFEPVEELQREDRLR